MMATMMAGLLLSFLIPRVGPEPEMSGLDHTVDHTMDHTLEMLEAMEAVEPLEPSREVVLGPVPAPDPHR